MEVVLEFKITIEYVSNERHVRDTFCMSDKAGRNEYDVLTAAFEWLEEHGYEVGIVDYFDTDS